MRILGIASSLRKGSSTTGLLRLAAKKLPINTTFEIYIPNLPLFNEDIEKDTIAAIDDFRAKLAASDGFLFSLCEYNSSLSPAIKNAIDWGSRKGHWNNKPAAIMSAGGAVGGIRSQLHFRHIASNVNLHVMNHPVVAKPIFIQPGPVDLATGEWKDETAKEVEKLMSEFVSYSKRFM